MAEDASLDDFLDAGDQEADPDESGESAVDQDAGTVAPPENDREDAADQEDGADPTVADPEETDVDPAATTLDWRPGGAACDACDEIVEHRWRDDGALVCESCKDW